MILCPSRSLKSTLAPDMSVILDYWIHVLEHLSDASGELYEFISHRLEHNLLRFAPPHSLIAAKVVGTITLTLMPAAESQSAEFYIVLTSKTSKLTHLIY